MNILVVVDDVETLLRSTEVDFDPVISDIAIPEMDGYELVRHLRTQSRSHDWPVVAVTGFGRAAGGDRIREAGFDLHLPKPVSLETITTACRKLVLPKRG